MHLGHGGRSIGEASGQVPGPGAGGEAVGVDAGEDGPGGDEEDGGVLGLSRCSRTNKANRMEARPRGPNQPAKSRVSNRVPDPVMPIRAGTMRMMVREATA